MIKTVLEYLLILCIFSYSGIGQNSYNFATVDSIGRTIEQTVARDDKTYINQLFDVTTFAEKFLLATENAIILDFNTEFIKSLKAYFDIGELLTSKGHYSLVRIYLDEKNNYHMVFRLYSEDGINYHDFLLNQKRGKFYIVDVYIFYTGRNLSDAYKERYMEAMTYQDFFNMTKDYRVAKRSFDKYVGYIKKRQYKKAYLASDYVADERRVTKAFKLLELKVAQHLPRHILNETIEEFNTSFPNDPSLYIRMIDYYFLRKEYDNCLESVEKVNMAVGGDTFFDIYRGNIYFAMGEFEKAKAFFEKMIKNYPKFEEGYDLFFAVCLSLEQYDSAVNTLNLMTKSLDYSKSKLIDFIIEKFPDFTKTTAYQTWQ